MGVRNERTGWRDLRMSIRHKCWGWDCPGVDIDFLMIEYDLGIPKALVEYKRWNALPMHPRSEQAICILADRANIPAFVVKYGEPPEFAWWKPKSINGIAEKIMPEKELLTEREWVTFLYALRGRRVDGATLDGINDKYILRCKASGIEPAIPGS